MIFGYQHFSYFRIVDSFANFICHKIRHKFIGFPINEHVSKIPLPNTKSFSCISILVKCLAFFFCNLEGASWIYGMDKTGRGFAAKFKELGITCTYLTHFLFGNWSIMQGCAPIRPSLKYGKRFCSLRYILNSLNAACACTNYCYTLAFVVNTFFGPKSGMAPWSLKILNSLKFRHCRC